MGLQPSGMGSGARCEEVPSLQPIDVMLRNAERRNEEAKKRWRMMKSSGREDLITTPSGTHRLPRENQGQAHSAVHREATALTQAAVHELAPAAQHEGMVAQMLATQALHAVFRFAPVVQTLCRHCWLFTLQDVPLQYVGTRSRQTSVQPVVQHCGLTAQTAETQELHPLASGVVNVQTS
jgi:hypothetical protein